MTTQCGFYSSRGTLELDLVDKEFRLLVPPSQFMAAPDAPDYLLPDFNEDGWDDDLVEFWNSALVGVERTVDMTPRVTTTPAPAAAATASPRRPGRNIATQSGVVMQASEILGTNVNDPLGANLGELTNLLLGSNDGKVYYGVLSYGGFLPAAAVQRCRGPLRLMETELILIPIRALDNTCSDRVRRSWHAGLGFISGLLEARHRDA